MATLLLGSASLVLGELDWTYDCAEWGADKYLYNVMKTNCPSTSICTNGKGKEDKIIKL